MHGTMNIKFINIKGSVLCFSNTLVMIKTTWSLNTRERLAKHCLCSSTSYILSRTPSKLSQPSVFCLQWWSTGAGVHSGHRHEGRHLEHREADPEGTAGTFSRLRPHCLYNKARQLLAKTAHLSGQPQIQIRGECHRRRKVQEVGRTLLVVIYRTET